MEPEAGRLVPPGESGPLADAVIELLADEPAREKLGNSARAIAQEKYSWDGIAQRLAEIYTSLTGSRSAVAA
jgi:glycosyltransferase involved in cell wall biosynthesis